jgi:hypothetical protein
MMVKESQIDKFRAAAKQHSCDESEKVFEEKLKKIATANTVNEKKKQKN